MSRSHHRRRYPSKSSPRKDEAPSFSQDCQRLERLLENLSSPFCSSLKVVAKIGEGTFSKVYLVKDGEDRKLAIKHLVPTASPDRILMEVECLKSAEGKENVLQLLFVHRLLGNVIFAMPYIECSKFSEVIKTLDHVEARLYMKNLLMAVAHIHQLGIIHRDIKPANFLYDRKRKIFRLVDFGLAQKTDGGQVKEGSAIVKEPSSRPSCKRKLTSSDLANSMESPPCQSSKKRKLNHPSGERGASRKVLSDKTADDLNIQNMSPNSKNTTPKKKTNELSMTEDETNDFYDRRGAILSARKRTRSSARQKRPQLSDEIDLPGETEQETQVCVQEPKTPIKNMATLLGTPEVRRSPRKHPSSSKPPGFSKLTISGSAIMSADKTNKLKRQGSFTMLDPASGIPSDGTPRLQASLTSRHSAALLLPGQFHFSLSSANLHASSLIMGHHPLRDSPLTLPARFATPPLRKTACQCFGRPRVCTRCLSKRAQRAARAGTPGFRPPEVLLKFEHQTTAVDIWATGVILLSILSRTYPFFRAPDDHTALAELVAMFGTRAVQEAADQYGKRFICSEQVEPVDLQVLCQRLGERRDVKSPEMASTQCLSTDLAADLLKKMLSLSSHERCSAQAALEHAFFEN